MGLFQKKTINYNAKLGIWKIEETIELLIENVQLSTDDQLQLKQLTHIKRKLEWLCTRKLVAELTESNVSISRNRFNKPSLIGSSSKISISHSGDYIAIILDEQEETGIDIQEIRTSIATIKFKFLDDKELNAVDLSNEIEHLHVYWGVKESLYKVYGREMLSFKNDISVEKFDFQESGEVIAKIVKADFQKEYKLHYEKLENYMLVYVMNN